MSVETAQYLLPGDYIGFAIRPSAGTITGFPRLPCFVGKGSRLAQYLDSEIIRSKITSEELTFTGTGPYTAVLDFTADGNKANTTLVDSGGVELDGSKYEFTTTVEANDSIIISSENYDTTETYSITYQSIERTVLDAVPYADLRNILRVGRGVGGDDFTEFTDFIIPVTVTDATADDDNNDDVSEGQTFGPSNGNDAVCVIQGNSGENITATADAEGAAGNGIKVITLSAGTESITEDVGGRTVTLQYNAGTSTTDSIVAASAALTLVTLTGTGTSAWGVGENSQEEHTTSMDIDTRAGDGNVSFASTSQYTHAYTRTYEVEVVGAGAAGTAVFAWSSAPTALGNDMAQHNPTHSTYFTTAGVRNEVTPASDGAEVTLEYGIKITVQDEGGTFNVGDKWVFTAYGPGTVEQSSLHENTNQFTTISAVSEGSGNTGDGVVTVTSSTSDYTGDWNRSYKLTVVAIGGGPDTTFAWTAIGDDGIATGTTSALADEGTATLDEGIAIELDLTAGNCAVGDTFTFSVSAPRVVPDVKDDRSYSMEVSTAAAGSVAFIYNSGTPEGGTGTFTATTADQSITFDGSLTIMVRNVATPRYVTGDIFTFTSTLDDTIDWSIQTEVSETIAAADIVQDPLGNITGTAGNYYVVLNKVAESVTSVQDAVPADVAYTGIVTDDNGDNTRFLDLGATDPNKAITVTYRHKGSEPTPGDSYRFSAYYLRGASLYNDPILITDKESGEQLLFPMATSNHLAIVNDMAWKLSPAGFFVVQVDDADEDGIYQDSDYDTAIEASESDSRITDLVVLSAWGTLNTQITQIDKLADPLQKSLRLLWLGAPNDTEIGDETTVGSLVYTAKRTLQVYGNVPQHGTRIMVAPTECVYTITPSNSGSRTVDVTLDGSFVAAAMCLQFASFNEPWQTVLRQNLSIFESVQTYSESERKVLGGAQINFLSLQGEGVYRWEEDVTVDPIGTEASADEFKQINAMMQKKYVVRAVSAAVDGAIISLTPEDPAAGIEALRNVIKTTLNELVSNNLIGRYLDANGNPRPINAQADIRVFQDTNRPTVYRYYFAFFLRYTIKYTFGQALVDSNDFGLEEAA